MQKPNRDIGFVTFETERARDAALLKLGQLRRPDSDLAYSVQTAAFMVGCSYLHGRLLH
jgi:hypothetical protein